MIGTLISLIPYLLASGTILLGLVEFFRKWTEHKSKPLRTVILTLLIIMGALTIISLRLNKNENTQNEKRAEEANTSLQRKLDLATKAENTAIQDQKNNTAQFLTKFRELSGQLSDIKQQVATADLQKRVASLQAELQKTQKAMAPGPKAKLTFTFAPYINPAMTEGPPVPLTDVRLPAAEDGSVHVQFAILNLSDANALNIGLTLLICDPCKFATEPEEFRKLPGDTDTHRWMAITALHSHEVYHTMSVDVFAGASPSFTIGIIYRCDTCVTERTGSQGTVHIMRDFLNVPKPPLRKSPL